ncbi:hypothetical protein [Anaerotalea alkaliphila]|uniref:Uncharacterized protein n=1 Tax=Anaerotalea alkaliphila TaxID=2662126 RepID=A0A7X5KN62_9FIRM|nr:hypothetical protein [Anaerotalea alkaliphila]NDL67458.1 hypothetical protein [Anaerotalea alkaliphila]
MKGVLSHGEYYGENRLDASALVVTVKNGQRDLVLEYDGTWLALKGQPADILLAFDDETPYGKVLGARPRYDEDVQTGTVAKGLLDIAAGDRIDYLSDYYAYDGNYDNKYWTPSITD